MTEHVPVGLKEGQKIAVSAWVKKMGHITWPGENKKRNPMTMLRKGHLIAAKIVNKEDEWDAAAQDNEKFIFYKRILSTDEVVVGKDRIVCFRSVSWKKMTTKNMFLAQFKDEDDV
jgi:hypothetical protein